MPDTEAVFRYRWRAAQPSGEELAAAASYRLAIVEAQLPDLEEVHLSSSMNGRLRRQGAVLAVEFVPGSPPPSAEEIAFCWNATEA